MGKGHGHGSDAPSEKRQVAGFDFLLPFLVVGTWVAFVIFGLAQEGVTRTKFGEGDAAEQFKFTTFLVLLQSIGNAVVAAVILLFTKGTKTSLSAGVPLSEWLIVALGYAGAHKFGLWSLLYIPFPLQVLLKSCKTIPVMIGGPPPPPAPSRPPRPPARWKARLAAQPHSVRRPFAGLLLDKNKVVKLKEIVAVTDAPMPAHTPCHALPRPGTTCASQLGVCRGGFGGVLIEDGGLLAPGAGADRRHRSLHDVQAVQEEG